MCVSCTASEPSEPIECESLDCPWMFERKKAEDKVESISVLEECINDLSVDIHSSPNLTETLEDDDQYVTIHEI
jgi:DNA polymerase zeta